MDDQAALEWLATDCRSSTAIEAAGEIPAPAGVSIQHEVMEPVDESEVAAEAVDAADDVNLTLSAAPPEAETTALRLPTPADVVEALLFASDTPLSAGRLVELVGLGTAADIRGHVEELNRKYAAAGLSFRIEAIARGYQMLTLPTFRPWLAKLNKQRGGSRLSEAALESLSIIAYRQPIIRADIEAIRGVACGDVLNRLREMGLVKVVGRAEIVGRPMLYGTTRKFLDVFGLADLKELPALESLTLRPRRAEPPSEGEIKAVVGA